MLEPYRVYDPCCGSAGMFVQSERFVEAHGGQQTDISIFGQESNPTTWRLAHMNLAIRASSQPRLSAPPTASCATCTPTSKPTTSSPIRRSTSRTGRASCWPTMCAGATVRRPSAMPTTLGSSTSSTTWPRLTGTAEASPASSWPTARSPPAPAGRAKPPAHRRGRLGGLHRRAAGPALPDHGIPACLWFLTRDKTGRNLKQGGRDRSRAISR